jgi:hypothetical protein
MSDREKMVHVEVPAGLAEAVERFVQEVEESTPSADGGRAADFAKYAIRRVLRRFDIDAARVVIGGKPHRRRGTSNRQEA